MNWKSAWAWFCGIAAGPITVLGPYIMAWNWNIPNEAKGSALFLVLVGLGLVNMKKPSEHDTPPQV